MIFPVIWWGLFIGLLTSIFVSFFNSGVFCSYGLILLVLVSSPPTWHCHLAGSGWISVLCLLHHLFLHLCSFLVIPLLCLWFKVYTLQFLSFKILMYLLVVVAFLINLVFLICQCALFIILIFPRFFLFLLKKMVHFPIFH